MSGLDAGAAPESESVPAEGYAALARVLDAESGQVLVVAEDRHALKPAWHGVGFAELQPRHERDWSAVGVIVADRLDLRAQVARAAESARYAQVRARVIAVHLEGCAGFSPQPSPWMATPRALRSRRVEGGGWLVIWRFARPVPLLDALTATAHGAVWRDRDDVGPRIAGSAPTGQEPTPAELTTDAAEGLSPIPVLGRAPVQVALPALEPIDSRVINPIGFATDVAGPVVELGRQLLTEPLVTRLRPQRGVRVAFGAEPDARAARTVAGLAMAGIPLICDQVPDWAQEWLAPISAKLTAPVDLEDRMAREEHSVVLRRAALDFFAISGWRREVGKHTPAPAPQPTVSVLLATRRAEMLEFALRQVARQHGVAQQHGAGLQLVLAPHGFEPDAGRVREVLGERIDLQIVPRPAEAVFGDVLNDAFEAASGDLVLKMDDDDWYARDFVADLLRARSYSGAEVVGMPADVHYLTEKELTVHRGHRTETWARFVAGGTMMVERSLLRQVGGFRSVRKYVDAQLLAAVAAAGAAIYRTHGLGYVLRRNPTGHTWQVDEQYLLDPSRVASTVPGFAPSRLMAVDAADRPNLG